LSIPIAHADGNYYIDEDGLKELEKNGQILLRYSNNRGEIKNVNGSTSSIAGVCNKIKMYLDLCHIQKEQLRIF